MKIPTKEELNEYVHYIGVGGLKGAAVGLFVSSAGSYFALRRYPGLRQRGTFFKTFSFMAPVLACGITNMEWSSRRFEAEHYGIGEMAPDVVARQKRLEKLPLFDRAMQWGAENKYKIIMGTWAATLGGTFWLINRDRLMTKSQKIVQARMYAQGVTVVLLLASMALTMSYGKDPAHVEETEDQSWKRIVAEEEERLKHEDQIKKQQQKQHAASA
ncbi:hypothetical protein TRICI_003385 [Trichomonascus ciferrii]|uniref:HIG1 domain-containing protein n=1 Tax=Trichomonascus ciferrii TaxID=44093 RepID=A0A642V3Z0_9ASCO|nr:hypothetical protein TRICI_003385 [Trichomonascus ciferrii]